MFGNEGYTESGSKLIKFWPNHAPNAFFAFTINIRFSVTIEGTYFYEFLLFQSLIFESKNYHSENNQYFSHNQKGILKFISYFLVLFLIFILWTANRILFIRQIMNLESQWLWTHYIAKWHFWTIFLTILKNYFGFLHFPKSTWILHLELK